MQETRDIAFRFGEYTLDLRRGCLLAGDREIALRPKSFELLRHLLENAGRLVTREELIKVLWPNVIVTDESVSRCMSDVRQALADAGHRIIRTVACRGYLLDVPVARRAPTGMPTPSGTVGGIAGAASARIAVSIPSTPNIGVRARPRLSIMVIPFASVGGDPAEDYLAGVITDSLTARLTCMHGAFVIARSTAASYKGRALDVRQIGRELGVRYVLEGSEQHCGARVRVTVQLADTRSGACLWADQVDTDRTDLLEMQDAIVTRLARALQIELLAVEAARLPRSHRKVPDSEELALRGEAIFLRYGTPRAEAGAAYDFCERALELDQDNVRALSILAEKHATRVTALQSTDRKADTGRAEALASHAIEIDPRSCHAHHAKARVLVAQKRTEEAIVEAERSLRLNPSFIPAYLNPSQAHLHLCRPQESIAWSDAALRLSPFDPYASVFHAFKAYALFMLLEDERAIGSLRQALANNPAFPTATAWLAGLLALSGREREAREMLRHYLTLPGAMTKTVTQWRSLAAAEGLTYLAFRERLHEGLGRAGMPEG